MTAPRRDLDFAPLTRGAGLGARLRAVGANNVLVMGTTVAVLVLVVPSVILAALLATGNATDGGGVACLVFFILCGAYAVFDALSQAGVASGLAAFAQANELESITGTIRRDYRGSLFADGSHLVQQAVRTAGESYVEVGDRFPTTPPATKYDANVPELYLRARLAGEVRRGTDPAELVTPELHERLTRFAGSHSVEVARNELTVFGSRALDPGEPGRVEEALALVDALVAQADVVQAEPRAVRGAAEPAMAASGIPVPSGLFAAPEPERGKARSAWKVVGLTLALVIVGPLVFALVLSNLSGSAALVAIPLLIAATFAVVGLLLRSSVTPRAGRPARD